MTDMMMGARDAAISEATWESPRYTWAFLAHVPRVTVVISESFTSGGASEAVAPAPSARERWLQRVAQRRASEPGPQAGDKQRDLAMGVVAKAISEGQFEVSRPE